MEDKNKHRIKFHEYYRGYEIMQYVYGVGDYTEYYFISKNGERESILCLSSIKAARNVIDTHIQQYPPILIPQ